MQSLTKHGMFKISMGCLFLSCKVDEEPVSLRHVLNAFDYIHQKYEDPNIISIEPIELFSMVYIVLVHCITVYEMCIGLL